MGCRNCSILISQSARQSERRPGRCFLVWILRKSQRRLVEPRHPIRQNGGWPSSAGLGVELKSPAYLPSGGQERSFGQSLKKGQNPLRLTFRHVHLGDPSAGQACELKAQQLRFLDTATNHHARLRAADAEYASALIKRPGAVRSLRILPLKSSALPYERKPRRQR